MATKVALQYGIFGGPLRAKKLCQALQTAGYQHETDVTKADIVICHSAGCFWLPDLQLSQKLILIDPPYWPEKTIVQRGRARLRSHNRYWHFGYPFKHWLHRISVSSYYAIFDARRNLKIMQHGPRYNLVKTLEGRQGILIRNEHDDWLTPELTALATQYPSMQIIHLPGDHDDCWYNPAPYINLLKTLQ